MKTTTQPSRSSLPRLWACMWRQPRNQIEVEPDRLDGKRALVTGGNGGIGRETAGWLYELGAHVTIACRNESKGRAAIEQFRRTDGPEASILPCDLADLDSVEQAASNAQRYDIVVNNAGVAPTSYSETKQGFESAFGVNVLGHVALTDALLHRGCIADGARVVWLTGDIYITIEDCTSDYRYRGAVGGWRAYSRSKLGSLWMRHAYAAEQPDIHWYAAHPGVVNSGLAKGGPQWLRSRLMISTRDGARTSVACAAQASLQPCYLHNTLGIMDLRSDDPGANRERATALLEHCRTLIARPEPRRLAG